jgi:hypothetical protein
VTCSTFLMQDNHCYKAFDGDASASSAWVTNPVGSRRHALSEPQWVTFDFGEGRAVSPTALRIVCDAKNAATRGTVFEFCISSNPLTSHSLHVVITSALGCPMSFMLQGSHDNVKFDVLHTQDLFDYDREYGPEGVKFLFIYDTVKGRVNGQRCGSCSSGPGFTCSVDSYDATCDSRYCGQDALCAPEPQCPAGESLHSARSQLKLRDMFGSLRFFSSSYRRVHALRVPGVRSPRLLLQAVRRGSLWQCCGAEVFRLLRPLPGGTLLPGWVHVRCPVPVRGRSSVLPRGESPTHPRSGGKVHSEPCGHCGEHHRCLRGEHRGP